MESNRRYKLWWQSSYDRGLDVLLFMWPEIKQKFPETELHIAYGWNLFDKANGNNPERMEWKRGVERLMNQDGITHYGRIGQDKLAELRRECGILAYPTYFQEINFIGALEAQSDGLVPVTMNSFAMKETVGSGIKIDGDIKDPKVQRKYLEGLFEIMGSKERWEEESKKAQEFAKHFTWETIADKWEDVFYDRDHKTPLVTDYTPTIRKDFFDVTYNTLRNQTYPNIEWIIIDDSGDPEVVEQIKQAQENPGGSISSIKHITGTKGKDYKRPHALSRANNTAWKNMQSDLLIVLQDFIHLPNTAVEDMVSVYKRNKDALIASVDEHWSYHNNLTPKERVRVNVRQEYSGIRETTNPYDFELNFGAIGKHVLDHLNGWWEFFDKGIGHDNVEIAQRALDAGYRIIIDDTIIARALDMGEGRHTNQRQWEIFQKRCKEPVRDTKLDMQIWEEIK
jgi:hypothetical protein